MPMNESAPDAPPGRRRSGPTRAMPLALLALAGALLAARIVLGILEPPRPDEGGPGAPPHRGGGPIR